MKLRMLIENESEKIDLHKEHGISLYIETDGRKILFDTGASGAFIANAQKMGVDIEDIDKVIISHAHSDHCGGLMGFLDTNVKAPVYISDKARREYYIKLLLKNENISVPPEVFDEYSDRICFISGFTQIDDCVYLVTDFLREYPLVKSSKHLLVESEGQFIRDNFEHEVALVINNGGKLIIITGCSHNGVDNMVETVIRRFPDMPIQTVIGGFHLMGFPFHRLMGESRANIVSLGKRLLDYRIERTYTCHCTGSWGYSVLKETMGDRIGYFKTGMQVEL